MSEAMRSNRSGLLGRVIPVELREAGLFAGDIRVYAASAPGVHGARLDEDVAEALGLMNRLYDSGPSKEARLHRCTECNRHFIAHWQTKRCSPDCMAIAANQSTLKAVAKRTEQRRHYAERRDTRYCTVCDAAISDAVRRPRFCSAACKQKAYRERMRCEA